jgi:hypothetical protein
MIIEKNPTIDNKTFILQNNIDITSEVVIVINGVVGVHQSDMIIANNTIQISDDYYIDWLNDSFVVMYN